MNSNLVCWKNVLGRGNCDGLVGVNQTNPFLISVYKQVAELTLLSYENKVHAMFLYTLVQYYWKKFF